MKEYPGVIIFEKSSSYTSDERERRQTEKEREEGEREREREGERGRERERERERGKERERERVHRIVSSHSFVLFSLVLFFLTQYCHGKQRNHKGTCTR